MRREVAAAVVAAAVVAAAVVAAAVAAAVAVAAAATTFSVPSGFKRANKTVALYWSRPVDQ
jgi:hypothetical protein